MSAEKGVALLFAVISLFVLLMLGGILFFMSYRESRVGTLLRFEREAFHAAEVGGEEALAWLDRVEGGKRVEPPLRGIGEKINHSGYIDNDKVYNTTIEFLGMAPVPGGGVEDRDYIFRITSEGSKVRTQFGVRRILARRTIQLVASRTFHHY